MSRYNSYVDVTAKELKLRLGKYLAAAACGETVRVTRRGKVVAELCPPALSARDKLERLAAQGLVRPGLGGPLPPYEPAPGGRSGAEIILEERATEGEGR